MVMTSWLRERRATSTSSTSCSAGTSSARFSIGSVLRRTAARQGLASTSAGGSPGPARASCGKGPAGTAGAGQHRSDLLQMLGLKEGSNGVNTPAAKDAGKKDRNAADELDETRAALFRRATGIALYISLDRPSIMFAMVDIMAGMAKPTVLHELRLQRLARYLLHHPTEVWVFRCQRPPEGLLVYTDSDWAADKETRRSISCLAERFGDHLLEVSVAKQTVVALSPGEAEFYGIVRAAAHGMQTRQLLEAVNKKLQLTVLSDASAARGMCTRTGSGKVHHLGIEELWVQQKYRDRAFDLQPVDTLLNWADLGTKAHGAERLDPLCRQMLLRREGRTAASSAAAGSSACAAGKPGAQTEEAAAGT